MIAGTLIYIIETIGLVLTAALMVRFLMQWTRAPQRNRASEFVNALTNFAVLPARHVIPGFWGLDMATLVIALLVKFVERFLVLALLGHEIANADAVTVLAVLGLAVISVFRVAVYVVIFATIVQAVVSWINPYSPVAPTLNALTAPLLRPFQRIVPPIANVDLSPLVLLVVCQVILMLPVAYLEGALLLKV